jgi:hypothetical protein
MGPIGCSETPLNKYQFRLRNIPEERKSQWNIRGSNCIMFKPAQNYEERSNGRSDGA